ncbi:DUF3293 domain-containing protein [Massilia sp. CF038]|uniref:DUF3293 domain-containing protein n=1 Tax=Massilia sp. CF038 TaxID=1881045 RepID=UPI000920FDCC|nr:DUF3293 domain-containing protein [Massilia sp. CF038]SHH12292.1 Protein of unknown function [Massilia sp. CF038]
MDTAIPPETVAAYLAADFIVDADPSFVMHIGQRCDAIAALGASCCAFITACNPLGEPADAAINEQRQAAFAQTLTERGLTYRTGAGCDPKEEWPCEPSFLILDLPLAEAKTMGQTLKQNAIVWCGADLVPQLILLR